MVWVYDNTHSGPVAQLMHCSYTGSLALFVPLAAISHIQDALVYAVRMVLLWLFVDFIGITRQWVSRTYPMNSRADSTIS